MWADMLWSDMTRLPSSKYFWLPKRWEVCGCNVSAMPATLHGYLPVKHTNTALAAPCVLPLTRSPAVSLHVTRLAKCLFRSLPETILTVVMQEGELIDGPMGRQHLTVRVDIDERESAGSCRPVRSRPTMSEMPNCCHFITLLPQTGGDGAGGGQENVRRVRCEGTWSVLLHIVGGHKRGLIWTQQLPKCTGDRFLLINYVSSYFLTLASLKASSFSSPLPSFPVASFLCSLFSSL